jgi:phosphatidylglycerol:prolipoprotein diacylglycerol transferase
MLALYITIAVIGLVLAILPEAIGRAPQLAGVKARLGKRADLILNIVGTVGAVALLLGGVLAFSAWRNVEADFSQGIQFDERESLEIFAAYRVRYYGIIIVVAMLVAASVGARLARVDGREPDHIWGALTWAIIPGILLARLWFITFPPITGQFDTAYYYSNFFNWETGGIAIWSGGLSIFGALLGGVLGAWVYFWRNGLAIPAWLDIAAVGLPLAQAIGRFANYVNQELYGDITTLPWGIAIDEVSKRVFPYQSTVDYPIGTLFHPLFLYEALWSLLAFVILLSLFLRRRHKLVPGELFLIYLMQYSVIRFLLEFLRLEITVVGGLNFGQVVCGVIFVVAGLTLFLRRRGSAAPRKELKDRPLPKPAPTAESAA